jgi:hypothetical protein
MNRESAQEERLMAGRAFDFAGHIEGWLSIVKA